MPETPESRTAVDPVPETPKSERRYANDQYDRPSHLNQALAWVAIVAGGLFIVAAIFFSGFFLSWGMGDHHMGPGKMDCCSQMKAGDHMAQGSMMRPGGPMTPGQMMPGMTMGPGRMMGPNPQSPTTSPPSTPRP